MQRGCLSKPDCSRTEPACPAEEFTVAIVNLCPITTLQLATLV